MPDLMVNVPRATDLMIHTYGLTTDPTFRDHHWQRREEGGRERRSVGDDLSAES